MNRFEGTQERMLSGEQQERLDALATEILPIVERLRATNSSQVSEELMNEIDDFKKAIKKEDIGISNEDVDRFVNDLLNAKEAA